MAVTNTVHDGLIAFPSLGVVIYLLKFQTVQVDNAKCTTDWNSFLAV